MNDFISRTRELQRLRALRSDSSAPQLAIIYGRRRVGKSRLVREAYKDQNIYEIEGLEGQASSIQIDHFVRTLTTQYEHQLKSSNINNWGDALLELVALNKARPGVIFLDEFQWLANYRQALVAHLKMIWDQHLSRIPGVTLVLCGSIASFMIKKVLHSKALYGRNDLTIHLKPFVLSETTALLSKCGEDEVFEAQMTVGGIPAYLAKLKTHPSVRVGLQREAFEPEGYFFNEYDRIFTSHFGRRATFERIIAVLARHFYGLTRKQLVQVEGFANGGALSRDLFELEAAGFVSQLTSFQNVKKRKKIFVLSDAYLRFYFDHIAKHREQILSERAGVFTKYSQTTVYSGWLGRCFELLLYQNAHNLAAMLGFADVDYSFGPMFLESDSKTRKGMTHQIDLVFQRADNVVTVCEARYRDHPETRSIISEIEAKVAALNLGARKTVQRVLITKSIPSNEVIRSGYFYKIIEAGSLIREAQVETTTQPYRP